MTTMGREYNKHNKCNKFTI